MARPTAPVHKLVITGTGRSGTTFVMQLLTELGLDTSYARGSLSDEYFEHCSAGLERDLLAESSPYVVKNPDLCETLPGLLATGHFAVDHVLVPVRELDDAARSRIRIGGEAGKVPGGLLGTSEPAEQKGVLAERFHRLMHTIARHDLPHTLLDFPRLALDADYAWAKLRFLVPDVDREAFGQAFKKVARPELIHQFGGAPPEDAGRAARQFLQAEQHKRRRRRARRLAAMAAIIAAALLVAGYLAEHARVQAPGGARSPQVATGGRP